MQKAFLLFLIKDQLTGKQLQMKLELFFASSVLLFTTQDKDVVDCLARRSAQHHQDIAGGTAGGNLLECHMTLLAAMSKQNFVSFHAKGKTSA